MSGIDSDRVAAVLVEVADTLVDEFDLVDFLQRVTAHATDLARPRICGLMLADHRGRLQVMAASDERAEMLELFQVQTQEGPCQDCFTTGAAVVVEDLRGARDRWPRFAPRALDAGFRAVHAFPMRLRGEVLGALNMFATDAGAMEEDEAGVVQALADIATIALLQERALSRAELMGEQLQAALNSRIVIEQAKGYVAQVHGESPDDAFIRIRSHCRAHGLGLSQVALMITTEPRTVPELTRSPVD